MKKAKELWVWLFCLLPILVSASVYKYLPNQVPIHWNLQGEIDNYSNKLYFMILLVPMPIIINFLMIGFAKIDPLQENYKKFESTYSNFRLAMVIFFNLLIYATYAVGLGLEINMKMFILVIVGILFTLIGNALKNIKRNYFFGIRTPWALYDDNNWDYTHQVGSKVFMACGIMMALIGALDFNDFWTFTVFILIIMFMVILPFVVSYKYFKDHLKSKKSGKK